jgi:hypothetical protein
MSTLRYIVAILLGGSCRSGTARDKNGANGAVGWPLTGLVRLPRAATGG